MYGALLPHHISYLPWT